MRLFRLAAMLMLPLMGCGESKVMVPATASVLNGPTTAALQASDHSVRGALRPAAAADGSYRLSPSKMSITVTGISMLPEGKFDPIDEVSRVSGCTATYDRSRGSLAVLDECSLEVPEGTYGGITILYSNTFDVVMDDAAAGIYSDPGAPGLLSSTPPPGGPQPIQVRDQNDDRDEGAATLFFASPVTIGKDSPPSIYVVFDPTHWIVADVNGGVFSAPRMSGNPPIIPSLSAFGKAAYYSNMATPMSYDARTCSGSSCVGFLFLYADDATPVTVTWQEHDLCRSMGGTHVVSFNGDGTAMGTYGRLGLDGDGTLAWASPGPVSGDHPPSISGYVGVFSMSQAGTVGDATTLSYRCTTDVPPPVSGPNYSSGAPSFTPDGTLSLTLLAQ